MPRATNQGQRIHLSEKKIKGGLMKEKKQVAREKESKKGHRSEEAGRMKDR